MIARQSAAALVVTGTLSLAVALLGSTPVRAQPAFPHRVTDGLADLRNDRALEADVAARERGRALLDAAAERHGAAAWRRHSTFEVVGVDRWREPGPWWPQQNQRVRLQQLIGTFTSRAELLDGPAAGQVWGIQSWTPYRQPSTDGEAEALGEPDLPIEFYLPTLHYFNELVFRLQGASTAIDAGRETLHGHEYRLVFVTWGDPHPRDEVDHYVVWIGEESGLVEKVHYTVRDIAAMKIVPPDQKATMRAGAAGTMHYSRYREVDGVQVPFDQVVTMFGPGEAPETPAAEYVHWFVAEDASFDAVAAEHLTPLSSLPAPADRKPAR